MTIKLRPPPGNFYARAAAWEAPIEAVLQSCPLSTANSQLSKGLNCPWNIRDCLHGEIGNPVEVSAMSSVTIDGMESLDSSVSNHICHTRSFVNTGTSFHETSKQVENADEKTCFKGQLPDSAQHLACSAISLKQQDLARLEMEKILILLRQGLAAGLGLDDGQVCNSCFFHLQC